MGCRICSYCIRNYNGSSLLCSTLYTSVACTIVPRVYHCLTGNSAVFFPYKQTHSLVTNYVKCSLKRKEATRDLQISKKSFLRSFNPVIESGKDISKCIEGGSMKLATQVDYVYM